MTDKRQGKSCAVIEVDVVDKDEVSPGEPRYRIYTSQGLVANIQVSLLTIKHWALRKVVMTYGGNFLPLQLGEPPTIEIRYTKTSEDAHAVFMHVYNKIYSSCSQVAQVYRLPERCHLLGSGLFRLVIFDDWLLIIITRETMQCHLYFKISTLAAARSSMEGIWTWAGGQVTSQGHLGGSKGHYRCFDVTSSSHQSWTGRKTLSGSRVWGSPAPSGGFNYTLLTDWQGRGGPTADQSSFELRQLW